MSSTSPPKKILITGASGYVGQHLTASIGFLGLKDNDNNKDRRYQLYCTYHSLETYEDDLKLIFDENQRLLHPSIVSITPIQINFSDTTTSSKDTYVQKIRQFCGTDGIDAIVHLGALSNQKYCEEHPKEAWSVNCPIGLLELDAPIIYLSTDEVYEGNKQCFYKEEFDDTIPINVYARTKLAFDRVLLRGERVTNGERQSTLIRQHRTGLLSDEELGDSSECRKYMPTDVAFAPNPNSVILRSAMILGPLAPLAHGCSRGQCPTFLQNVAAQISRSTPSNYFSNIFRSVVHVDDVIYTIKHFLHKTLNRQQLTPYRQELARVEVFNLGGSKRESHYDVALEVARRLRVDESLVIPVRGVGVGEGSSMNPKHGALRYPNVSINIGKLLSELRWAKTKSLTSVVKASFYNLPSLYAYARQKLTRDNCHFTFSPSHQPALRIQPNEMVHIETFDCFKGAYFEPVEGELDNYALHEQPIPVANPESVTVARSKLNPVTGPIHVEGALPGDILSVKVHHIHPRRRGVTASFGPGTGQLGKKVGRSCIRYFDIKKDRKSAAMIRDLKDGGDLPDIVIPCHPMLGVIGVAPAEGEVETMPAGTHGGNLDNRENGMQSTIHIQVKQPGALLSIGDMHAAQGDGEICGCGIEISGDVLLSCSLIKKLPGQEEKKNVYPVTETVTHWITHGVAVEDIPKATTLASEEAATLLVNEWGFTYEDALVYLGVAGNLGLCQSIHPCQGTVIAKMSVPKIAASPRPYKDLIS